MKKEERNGIKETARELKGKDTRKREREIK